MRDRLSPNAALPHTLVYTPIEAWSDDDVWMFLMQVANPWGYNNKDLLTMYQGASPDGECPLVVDSSTPSCGDSRFGCWVCTLVDKDKSMTATSETYPGAPLDDNLVLGENEMELLREVCGQDRLQFELARELLSVERQQRTQARRAGLFERREKSISRHYYDSRDDAVEMARRHARSRHAASLGQGTLALAEFADDAMASGPLSPKP